MGRTLPFRGSELIITKHAIERLQKRWAESGYEELSYDDAVDLLSRLLADATPARIRTQKRVNRIINNGFKLAEYWASSGMRLVIVKEEERQTLVTVERNSF